MSKPMKQTPTKNQVINEMLKKGDGRECLTHSLTNKLPQIINAESDRTDV